MTTADIAKAWQYRDLSAGQLSFQLRGSFKTQYVLVVVFGGFCLLTALGGAVALVFGIHAEEVLPLIGVSLIVLIFTLWVSQGLLWASHLAKLEKERSRISNDAAQSQESFT